MKKNLLYLFSAGVMLMASSCSDYLDVNTNPNNPQYGNIPPNLTLSAAETLTYRAISGDNQNFETSIRTSNMNQLGNIMMNSWAGNVNVVTNPFSDEYRGNVTSSFYDNIWDWTYRNVGNFQQIINYNSENFDNHKAIAKILKSFYMQDIVDLYGDVPYFEAFQGQANLYPAYDDDKAIYRALVTQIDEAIALINNANSDDVAVGGEDAMLHGNMSEWVKFANTIKLRLLIRQSGLTDAETVAYIDAQLDTLLGAQFVDSEITINPGYSSATANSQNPFYGEYGYTIAGQATAQRTQVVASAYAANVLNSTSDPRRSRIFAVGTSGNVVGVNQGEDSGTAPSSPSLFGPAIVPTDTEVGSSMDGYVMTLSEAKFLLAEAAYKYPSKFPGYDAKTLFEQGIEASFTRLGATGYAGYLATISTLPGFGWDATTDKIEAIMTQKWIATMSVTAQESWIDYNRTGYPSVPLAVTNSGVGRPKRLMYPTSEYVSNSSNVQAQGQTTATVFATGPFWAQ